MADERTPELRVAIRVRPGSSRADVGGTHGDALVVRVCERAVDGRATEAALRGLAAALGVRTRDVRLVSGVTSRDKVVAVSLRDASAGVPGRLERLRAGDGTGPPDE